MEYKFSGFEITTLINDIGFFDELFHNGQFVFTEDQLSAILKIQEGDNNSDAKTELKLNFLYDYSQRIVNLKIKIDFIYSYLSLSTNIKKVPADLTLQIGNQWKQEDLKMKKQEIPVEDFYYIEDFECISSNLSDYLLIINTEIDILEAANGKKYWKEILYRPGKKSTINKINRINNQSADFIKQKDVLILILKNFKGVINDKVNNTKLGEAISLLTYSIFSSEQIRQKLPKQEDKKEIYIEAIKKLKDTVIQLENDLSRIKK